MADTDKILSLLIKIGKIDEADLPELKKQLGGLGDTGKTAGEKVGRLGDEAKAGAEKFKLFHGEGLEMNKVIGGLAAQADGPAFLENIRARQDVLAGAARAAQEYTAHLETIRSGEAEIIAQLTTQLALQKAINAARAEPAGSEPVGAKIKAPATRGEMPPTGTANNITNNSPQTIRDGAAHKPAAEDPPAAKSNDLTASQIARDHKNPGTLAAQSATGEAGPKQIPNDFANNESNPARPKKAEAGLESGSEELTGQNSSCSRATEDSSPDQDWSSTAELRAAIINLTEAILANRSVGNVTHNNPATVTTEETAALNKRTEKFQTADAKAAGTGHFDEAVHQLNESQAFGRQLAQAAKDAAKAHSESAGVILQALADLRASNQKLQEQIHALQATGSR